MIIRSEYRWNLFLRKFPLDYYPTTSRPRYSDKKPKRILLLTRFLSMAKWDAKTLVEWIPLDLHALLCQSAMLIEWKRYHKEYTGWMATRDILRCYMC